MKFATVPTLTVAQVLALDCPCIDLRAPVEFGEDHLPRAHNAPLFGDQERALIGSLYRRASPAAAFDEGRLVVQRRIVELVEEIARVTHWRPPSSSAGQELVERVRQMTEGGLERLQSELQTAPLSSAPAGAIVLHCWRGGLRSRSMVSFLRALGCTQAVALEGGYHAYRLWVNAGLARWQAPPAFVLRGLTGVGKTLVLRELERLQPGWTVDLEELAGHRSSILGMVGLEPRTQKQFEGLLLQRLLSRADGPLVLEGESRKVGDLVLPPRLWAALEGGTNFELCAPLARRVDVLLEDYLAAPGNRDELRAKLPFLEERLGSNKWKGQLVARLEDGRERELVEILLELYYDPLYRHSEKGRSYCQRIDASDPRRAAQQIAAALAHPAALA